jgi:hypothetical protein
MRSGSGSGCCATVQPLHFRVQPAGLLYKMLFEWYRSRFVSSQVPSAVSYGVWVHIDRVQLLTRFIDLVEELPVSTVN